MDTTSVTQMVSGRGGPVVAAQLYPGAEPFEGYKLVRYLGRGGFGEVWEAEAPGGLSKAIKMAPMGSSQAAMNCRELEGLKKVRSIRHPYLLSIERFEVIDGYLCIVMELADKSLADRYDECMAQGHHGIPRDELLRYMREASEVLDLMNHQHGLQHLDVKPENLFLLGGHIKVADFGLVSSGNTKLSQNAVAISPPYAPPELFDGRIEATADQYSLAVTYQELLTGRRPYPATEIRELIFQHLRGRPDLSALPPSDRPVVSRALQRDVVKRFPGCTELVDALFRAATFGTPVVEEATSEVEPTAPLQRPPTSRTMPLPTKPAATPTKPIAPKPLPSPAAKTVPVSAADVPTQVVERRTPEVRPEEEDIVKETFVGMLPLEIYAHKLRGFMDAMDAERVSVVEESTTLAIRTRGWFGLKTSQAVYVKIDSCTVKEDGANRVVEVSVWAVGHRWTRTELVRRGMLLIRCLREFLMAVDSDDRRSTISADQMRATLTS